MYNKLLMRRLINQNQRLTRIYLERYKAEQPTDYGEKILEKLFLEIVIHDPIIRAEYKDILLAESKKHEYKETSVSNSIQLMIKLYGWQSFVEGFILHAKNKELKLQQMGLDDESKAWDKVAKILNQLPKRPQF